MQPFGLSCYKRDSSIHSSGTMNMISQLFKSWLQLFVFIELRQWWQGPGRHGSCRVAGRSSAAKQAEESPISGCVTWGCQRCMLWGESRAQNVQLLSHAVRKRETHSLMFLADINSLKLKISRRLLDEYIKKKFELMQSKYFKVEIFSS